jgi:hypothetical protein
MNMRKFSCIFLLMCASWQANAQLTVTTVTPAEAVAALVGPDLEVSNITYTGDVIQVGTYQNAGGNFPISNGVILCTSGVENFEPNGLGGEPLNGVMVEPDLLEIANSVPPLIGQTFTVDDVNDVAILEFDFVASGPILTYKYVFGSDE